MLTVCPEGLWVRDLGSRNGTFVDEEALPDGQACLVDSDARIRFIYPGTDAEFVRDDFGDG